MVEGQPSEGDGIVPTFTAKPTMGIVVPPNLEEYVKTLKDRDKSMEVTISEAVDARTAEQNALFHVLVRQLSEQCGMDELDTKEYVKMRAIALGYPVWVEDGRIRCDDEGRALPKPTSEANVKDLMLLMDACHIVADENGFELKEARR